MLGAMRLDTVVGMGFSNLITFFIITTSASTLGVHGITSVATAAEAAEALRPLAGGFASLLFALGIIGTGLLAIPVLAGSASYAISEALGWKEGLFRTFQQAPGFYGVIIAATLVGLVVNLIHVPPFLMLYYAAVINGIIAPPLLVVIMLVGRDEAIMGHFRNSCLSNVLGWILTVGMSLVAAVLCVVLIRG
jgi:Mn2+/Fe2+ NRAMP family transporter